VYDVTHLNHKLYAVVLFLWENAH